VKPARWLPAACFCLGVAHAAPAPAPWETDAALRESAAWFGHAPLAEPDAAESRTPLAPWSADLLWARLTTLAADVPRTGLDPLIAAVAEAQRLSAPTARRVLAMAFAVFRSRPGVVPECSSEAGLEACKARLRALLPEAERLYFESGRSALALFALYHAHVGVSFTAHRTTHAATEALPATFAAFLDTLDPAEGPPLLNLLLRESFWPLHRHLGPLVARVSAAAPLPPGTRLLLAMVTAENGQDPGPDLRAVWAVLPALGASDALRRAVAAEILAGAAGWQGTAESFTAFAASLPAVLRAEFEAGPLPAGRFTLDTVEFDTEALDLRPAMAVARALAGDAKAALRLAEQPVGGPPGTFLRVPANGGPALVRARFDRDGRGAWDRVVALTQHGGADSTSLVGRLKREIVSRAGHLPGPGRWTTSPGPPDALTAGLAKRLSAPALMVFREVEAPPPAADATITAPTSTALSLPPGFRALFVESRGAGHPSVGVVATSRALDPTGEVTFGGYWWLESADAGAHWAPPLYLGLREARPYALGPHAVPPQAAPAAGESIVLPAREQRLEEASIRLPPVDLRFGAERPGLWLSARREDLQRDTDADGLTDLVEDRLGTDPRAADTDADRLNDAVDPSPLVARAPTRGFDDAVRVECLRWLDADRSEGVVPGPGHDVRGTFQGSDALAGAYFIQADRAAWRGVSLPGRRVVVLSPEEVAAMDRRFGRTFAVTFEPILLDPRGQRALVRVNQGWTAATLELKRVRGRWTVKVHAKLITRMPDGFKSARKALG
jgi:hypothetical protein